jgi:hypothetical protein
MTVAIRRRNYNQSTEGVSVSRSNSNNSEVLVPVAEIAGRFGFLPEMIEGRVKPGDLRHDWDGAVCVDWSVAKSLYEKMLAEKAAYEREQAAAMNAQMDNEQRAREYPLRAYENALRTNRVAGIQVTVPPASETEEWAK